MFVKGGRVNKLSEFISLKGKIETISMMDLRTSPGEVITQAELGKTYIIERNGKPVALLNSIPTDILVTMKRKKESKK